MVRGTLLLPLAAAAATAAAAAATAPPTCTLFAVTDNSPQIDGPPAGSTDAQLDVWWAAMQVCRAAQLAHVNYTAAVYADPSLAWTQGAFAIPMTQGYDRFLWDPDAGAAAAGGEGGEGTGKGAYTVDRYLDDLEARFGGVDAVFLWPTYTNIGLDDRNQLDLFRAMPGGLPALRGVSDAFHARGVHAMWGYNPWDTGTRREAGWVSVAASDGLNITAAAAAGGADGFNMDTMGSTPVAFRDAARALGHPMAYQVTAELNECCLALLLLLLLLLTRDSLLYSFPLSRLYLLVCQPPGDTWATPSAPCMATPPAWRTTSPRAAAPSPPWTGRP